MFCFEKAIKIIGASGDRRCEPFENEVLHNDKAKMKKLLISIISLFLINYCLGQNIKLTGTINDCETNQPLPYATIELFSLKTGTITDKNGKFSLEITTNDLIKDSINFSFVGYETTKMSINDFMKTGKTVQLKEKPIELREIKIIPKKYSTEIIGIKDKQPWRMQYANLFSGNKGNYIKNKKGKTGWIKSVSYYIHPDGHPTTPFRVRIYSVGKDKKPAQDILNQNLVVSAKEPGWFTVDVSEYNIPFPENGAFVMMEWINSGDEYYFEKEIPGKGKNGKSEMVKRKYYGQSLGTVSKKGGIVMWGNNLGNEWIPYDFNYKGNYINAMINVEIIYEKL